jgi:hypothetical protein
VPRVHRCEAFVAACPGLLGGLLVLRFATPSVDPGLSIGADQEDRILGGQLERAALSERIAFDT